MRLRVVVPIIALAAMLPAGYLLLPRPERTDSFDDGERWTPTPGDIAAAVGPGKAGTWNDARHIQFANMFKQRYRDHTQAVGLKFLEDSTVKAMFAPTIPRWDMARVATQASREVSAVFGRFYRVDIYETYITAPMRKLGEVHESKDPNRRVVFFDPRFALEQAARSYRPRRPNADAPTRQLLLRPGMLRSRPD